MRPNPPCRNLVTCHSSSHPEVTCPPSRIERKGEMMDPLLESALVAAVESMMTLPRIWVRLQSEELAGGVS